eukprot:1091266-Ditylum_brightwellii.AAC.1
MVIVSHPKICFKLNTWTMGKDAKWFDMFQELKKYKDMHGHCSVPTRCSFNKHLANWASRQRQKYWEMKEGKSLSMTAEHGNMLNSLGFAWKLHENDWHKMLDDLKEYKERHGDCLIPLKYAPDPCLGCLVYIKRQTYMHIFKGGR